MSGAGGPFGAVVVQDGQVVGEGWNNVVLTNDPTAHAEIIAIRAASAALGSFQLPEATIYCSCEPCPMCLGAIYWARPSAVYFASTHHDAAAVGFDDSLIQREVSLVPDARSLPFQQLDVTGAADVFELWASRPDRIDY